MSLEQRKNWGRNHKILSGIISKPEAHATAAALFLELHSALYASVINSGQQPTFEDSLWSNLSESTLRSYPVYTPGSHNSIVWHIWHSARIEDITMNILGADREQVLHSEQYAERLQTHPIHPFR